MASIDRKWTRSQGTPPGSPDAGAAAPGGSKGSLLRSRRRRIPNLRVTGQVSGGPCQVG